MTISSYEDVRRSVWTYLKVFAALMALTGLTVTASYFHLVIPLAVAVAVLIAALKSSLVAGFFMHLIGESPAIFAALALTALLLAALFALPLLGLTDQIGTFRNVFAQTQMEH